MLDQFESINAKRVSVLMLAWNHEAFIGQAIESILQQQFDGSFELLVGEDSSSDKTLSICLDYQLRYPEIVRVIAHSKNIGMHLNFQSLWNAAHGDYIALCEGDDYWVDHRKLQKQVDFLSEHSECNLCGAFTQKKSKELNGEWRDAGVVRPDKIQDFYAFKELIPRYNFHFSSVVLRKDSVEFPDWFHTVYCVDRPLYLLATQSGMAGLIPEVMSVYRLHEGGNWSAITVSKKARASIDLITRMRDHFDSSYAPIFERTLSEILWSYISEDLMMNEKSIARRIYWQSLRFSSIAKIASNFLVYSKVFIRLYIPALYRLKRGWS